MSLFLRKAVLHPLPVPPGRYEKPRRCVKFEFQGAGEMGGEFVLLALGSHCWTYSAHPPRTRRCYSLPPRRTRSTAPPYITRRRVLRVPRGYSKYPKLDPLLLGGVTTHLQPSVVWTARGLLQTLCDEGLTGDRCRWPAALRQISHGGTSLPALFRMPAHPRPPRLSKPRSHYPREILRARQASRPHCVASGRLLRHRALDAALDVRQAAVAKARAARLHRRRARVEADDAARARCRQRRRSPQVARRLQVPVITTFRTGMCVRACVRACVCVRVRVCRYTAR